MLLVDLEVQVNRKVKEDWHINMVVGYYVIQQAIENNLNEPQKEMVKKKCTSLKSNTMEISNSIP